MIFFFFLHFHFFFFPLSFNYFFIQFCPNQNNIWERWLPVRLFLVTENELKCSHFVCLSISISNVVTYICANFNSFTKSQLMGISSPVCWIFPTVHAVFQKTFEVFLKVRLCHIYTMKRSPLSPGFYGPGLGLMKVLSVPFLQWAVPAEIRGRRLWMEAFSSSSRFF